MPTSDLMSICNSPLSVRLEGGWKVCAIEPDDHRSRDEILQINETKTFTIPDSIHLQPALYPNQPYWGKSIRAINDFHWLYRRTFRPIQTNYKRTRLRFDGVDYFAEVWLNGHFLGRHEGNFVPFEFDISRILQTDRENVLTVGVSSPWDAPYPNGTYPLDHVRRGLVKGLYEHGEGVIPPDVNPIGIWKPVWIIYDNGLSIDHMRINTNLDGLVSVHMKLSNSTGTDWYGNCDLNVSAKNHNGPGITHSERLSFAEGGHDLDFVLQVPDPHLWWPWDHGQPNLYQIAATLYQDSAYVTASAHTSFGIRTVVLEREPERFTCYINDRPVFLRGTAYIPGLYLSLIERGRLVSDLTLAREANLNLLRCHIHVSVPDFYELCDEMGILVWQDFELNWVHDASLGFEHRARILQREMIDILINHPSIIAWSCHNEPTMRLARRFNLEQHPDPALYADAVSYDPTRMVFLCSGHLETDWLRSGDSHTYFGAIWSRNYTDIYRHRLKFNTEFGFEAPAALTTLQEYTEVWARLQHLEGQIEGLWQYQADLIKFHVEHLRRLRADCSAGYIHFWLIDLVPQVGCGVIDAQHQLKTGYAALREASQPLHIALEHNGHRPIGIWVFNDLNEQFERTTVGWQVFDPTGHLLLDGTMSFDIAANRTQQVMSIQWNLPRSNYGRITLSLKDQNGRILASNSYEHPFSPLPRPKGYPWKFDIYLGTKVFNMPDAPSLADVGSPTVLKLIPLILRERFTEFVLRQQFPDWFASNLARIIDRI